MMRLTVTSQTKAEATLKVEGWVSGTDAALLEQEGTRLLEEVQRLVLDLTGVKFIDRAGLAFLKHCPGDRLALRGGSLFVQALLQANGLCTSKLRDYD